MPVTREAAQAELAAVQHHFSKVAMNPSDESRRTAAAGLRSMSIVAERIDELEQTIAALRVPAVAEPERE